MRSAAAFRSLRFRGRRGARQAGSDRLPRFLGAPADAQEILRGIKVLAVGAGSVGARAIEHLARLHVGEIAIVDPKRFSAGFDTQDLRGAGEVGGAKAIVVGRRAAAISPETTVRALQAPIAALPWMALDRYDVVVASTDNLAAETDVGQACTWLGKPLVYASVHGPSLTVQVRTFRNRDGNSPCPACGFSRAEREAIDRQVRYSCGDSAPIIAEPVPTMGVSALCALAADLAVLEVLRGALRLGPPPRDAMLEFNAYRGATCTMALARNPACPCDHTVFTRAEVGRALRDCTLRECADAAGVSAAELPRTSFGADDRAFAWMLTCGDCGETRAFNRFIGAGERLRCRCGARSMSGQRYFTFDRFVPAQEGALMARLDVPLCRLRAGRLGVAVRNERRAVLVRSRANKEGRV